MSERSSMRAKKFRRLVNAAKKGGDQQGEIYLRIGLAEALGSGLRLSAHEVAVLMGQDEAIDSAIEGIAEEYESRAMEVKK